MDSLRSIFSEVASLAVGVGGAAINAQGVFMAVDLLFAAGGVPPGLVTGMMGLVMVGVGAAAGGVVGYKGAKALMGSAEEGEPSPVGESRPSMHQPAQRQQQYRHRPSLIQP